MRAGNLTVTRIRHFAKFLRHTKTKITYGQLRQYYGMFCLFGNTRDTVEWDSDSMEGAAEWISLHGDTLFEPDRKPPPQFSDVSSDLKLWMRHHLEMMREVTQRHEENMEAMVDFHGSATCPDNMYQLWENFGESPDVDAARHFAIQAARLNAKEMVAQSDITKKNLHAYIKMLEKSLEDIEEEEQQEEEEV